MSDVRIEDLQPLSEGVPTYAPYLYKQPPFDDMRDSMDAATGIIRGLGLGIAVWVVIVAIIMWVAS